jgi:hypothetical protein
MPLMENIVNSSDEGIKTVKNSKNNKISGGKIRNFHLKSFKVGGNIRAQKNLLNERSVQIALMPKIDNTNGFDSITAVARISDKEIFAGISWLTMIRIHFASIVVQAILKYEEEKRANGVDKKNKRIEEFNRTELLLNQARKQDHLNREQVNNELNSTNEYNNEFKNIYLPNSTVSSIPKRDVDITDPTTIRKSKPSLEGKTAKSANFSGISAKNRNTKSMKTKNNISITNLGNKILPGSTGGITPSVARKIGNSIGIFPNPHERNVDNDK